MPSYLDQYGAGEERRNSILLRIAIVVLSTVAVVGLGWYVLKNHHQEGVVKTFLQAVRQGDYQGAYRDWGCTSAKPCSGYEFNRFMSDWGPAQPGITGSASSGNDTGQPDLSVLGITESESCNSGVMLTVNVNSKRTEKLWVDKSSDAISFAPYPICPHKSPFEIMIHRTFGQLRKPLLK
jgi:hypothetical protein